MSLVANADAFARLRHAEQIRKGAASEPYTNHLEEVAELVSRWGGVEAEIAAAWLHDTVEDCPPTSLVELKLNFGNKVADIVAELTDNKSLPKDERKRLQIVNAPKKSESDCLVKLADKSSNVAAISNSPPTDWSLERRIEYIEGAKSVVDGLKHKPAAAEDDFSKGVTERSWTAWRRLAVSGKVKIWTSRFLKKNAGVQAFQKRMQRGF
jgi:hypothetical protein